MSTSEPKPKKDEAPASETAAEPGPTDTAAPAETPAATQADAKPETEAEPQPAAAASQAGEPDPAPAGEPASASADEPVWPPPESKPDESLPTKPDEPAVLTKPEEPPAAVGPDEPASLPKQELALSESTLHWLVDGEQPIEVSEPNPILAPIYDARAPVAGRKRTFAIIGGAAVLSLGIAWALHAQAAHHRTVAVASADDSADLLVHRAEAALAQGRAGEALDLARLAIVTDPGLANAYIIIGAVERSGGQTLDARDSYRHYLELAPLGTHAAEARAALKTLPP
jgi:tetratricopeptide (TPR) repeat protein